MPGKSTRTASSKDTDQFGDQNQEHERKATELVAVSPRGEFFHMSLGAPTMGECGTFLKDGRLCKRTAAAADGLRPCPRCFEGIGTGGLQNADEGGATDREAATDGGTECDHSGTDQDAPRP